MADGKGIHVGEITIARKQGREHNCPNNIIDVFSTHSLYLPKFPDCAYTLIWFLDGLPVISGSLAQDEDGLPLINVSVDLGKTYTQFAAKIHEALPAHMLTWFLMVYIYIYTYIYIGDAQYSV